MFRYTVGSVPYLNAKPLVKPLLWLGSSSPIKVNFEVPSRLPALLESGQVQAILVSSVAALLDPRSTIAADLSISTQREVKSVRLFSKVPFNQISTLAEDESSMTSNALAKILLAELFDVKPNCRPAPPDGATMLSHSDACILIGDKGMAFGAEGLFVLDLGEAWWQMSGLPFVWAVWKGHNALTEDLVGGLQCSLRCAKLQMDRVLDESARETGFSRAQCDEYLLEVMDYRLTPAHLEALDLFAQLLVTHRLASETFQPKVIHSDVAGNLIGGR